MTSTGFLLVLDAGDALSIARGLDDRYHHRLLTELNATDLRRAQALITQAAFVLTNIGRRIEGAKP
jgi:hypothetical protein